MHPLPVPALFPIINLYDIYVAYNDDNINI